MTQNQVPVPSFSLSLPAGKRGVVLFSGGMDSSTLVKLLLTYGHEVEPISVNYGQRHGVELTYAQNLCSAWGIDFREISVPADLFKGSSQTSHEIPVPQGHYADENMKLTVVPNRNMMMLSLATAYAISREFDFVAYAAHAGDHTIYPDCRPEFVSAMRTAMLLADWHQVELYTPFIHASKADICSVGDFVDVPWESTWSCYEGDEVLGHCGKCGTCVERREAFELAHVVDPTTYQS